MSIRKETGLFHDVDADTGKELWSFDARKVPGAGGATAAPIVYAVKGREFIANGFGGNPGEDASNLGDAIIAFSLPTDSDGGGDHDGSDHHH